MNTSLIKIYGLQRSGTNYVSYLMNENFINSKMLVNIGGWKHGHYIPCDKSNVITVFKNPYAWLWSVYKYWGPDKKLNIGPNLENVSFEEFIKSKAVFEPQNSIPYLIRAANAVEYWNNMNYHWLSIRVPDGIKVANITYESTIISLHSVLLQLMDLFDLVPKCKKLKFVGCEYNFIPSGEKPKIDKDKPFSKLKYYASSEYMKHYTPELIEFVNGNLDWEVMHRLGYRKETL